MIDPTRIAGTLGAAALCLALVATAAENAPVPSAATDTIGMASPAAAAVEVPSAPDAWGGPRNGQEPTLSDRVVAYRIEAKLDADTHTIDGRERLTWRNRSGVPVHSVYLHLYLNAFRSEGSTYFAEQRILDGAPGDDDRIKAGEWGWIDMTRVEQDGAAVQSTFAHPDGGPESDMTVVRLDLAHDVAPGSSATLDIDFIARLPRVISRTGWFGTFHLVAQWFPKIAVLELAGERGATGPRWNAHEFHYLSEFYADFGRYDVTLDVPANFVVGATGEEQGAPVVSGDRARHRFVQDDVHDFAWTADSRFAEPMRGQYKPSGGAAVDIRVMYTPEYAASAEAALGVAREALEYFSRTLGPYPYRTVTVVIPPYNASAAAGMEYPTFFTTDAVDDVPADSLKAMDRDGTTIHEFGHGYFYGILASNEFEEPMLDEGLNQYWETRMESDRAQRFDAVPSWLRWLGLTLPVDDRFAAERMSAMLDKTVDGTGANSWNRLSSSSYGSVYGRTAVLMRDLEARIGKPEMARAMKDYYETWKFRHPSIADLRASLANATGRADLIGAVFDRQVYATRRMDDRVVSLESEPVYPIAGRVDTGTAPVIREQTDVDALVDDKLAEWRKAHPDATDDDGAFPWRTTVLVERHGSPAPQEVVVVFDDGSRRTMQWDDGSTWKRFSFELPHKAISAQIDATGAYYLDVSKLDDSQVVDEDVSAARRWSADFAAVFQAVQALLVSL